MSSKLTPIGTDERGRAVLICNGCGLFASPGHECSSAGPELRAEGLTLERRAEINKRLGKALEGHGDLAEWEASRIIDELFREIDRLQGPSGWTEVLRLRDAEATARNFAENYKRDRDEARAAREAAEAEVAAVIDERDNAQDWADKLSWAIAPLDEIGEHSNANNPWANAVEIGDQARADAKRYRGVLVGLLGWGQNSDNVYRHIREHCPELEGK